MEHEFKETIDEAAYRDSNIRGLIRLAHEFVKDCTAVDDDPECFMPAGLFLSKTNSFTALVFREAGDHSRRFLMFVLDLTRGNSYTVADLAELDENIDYVAIDEEFLRLNEVSLKDYVEYLIGESTLEFKCVPQR